METTYTAKEIENAMRKWASECWHNDDDFGDDKHFASKKKYIEASVEAIFKYLTQIKIN